MFSHPTQVDIVSRLVLRALFAVLVCALVLPVLQPRPAGATSPGADGQIAFTSQRDGNREIYVMNTDGTEQTRLTHDDALDIAPAWSPDGSQIAFYSDRDGNREIYVMNADGTGQTRLTNHDGRDEAPAWSPDGTQIAFHSTRDGNQEIYVMNADGTALTRLTNHPEDDVTPTWSPDGTQIAFTSYRHINFDVYVMNADGTGQTRLTHSGGMDSGPTWSPDGTQIAFTSFRDFDVDVYVMNMDGTGQTRLTNNDAWDGGPTWSPDGTQITFSSDRDGNGEIYVMNADGTGQTRLTNNDAWDGGAAGRPVAPGTTAGVHRLSGDDRFETAARIARARFDPDEVDTIYLAVGSRFPDALAGGPLAARDHAPILLTRIDALPDVVADTINMLAPARVVALGGPGAITDEVLRAAGDAAGGASLDRLWGQDRFATAAAIAAELAPSGTDRVFLSTGTNFPDALAGGPATGGDPILLTRPENLSEATATALDGLAPSEVVALGGKAAVAEGTLARSAVAAGGATTDRLYGTNRFSTAAAIASTLGDVGTVYVATGSSFPDALVAGPAASVHGAPILLTAATDLPDPTRDHLAALSGLERIVVLGGKGAVGSEVVNQLAALLDDGDG